MRRFALVLVFALGACGSAGSAPAAPSVPAATAAPSAPAAGTLAPAKSALPMPSSDYDNYGY